MENISQKDRLILRELAKQQYALSQSEEMQQLRRLWLDHNDCKPSRPILTVELWSFPNDIIPPLLKCEGEKAREVEFKLYGNMVNHTLFKDDSIVPDHWGVSYRTHFLPFDLPVKTTHASDGGLGYHFENPVNDLEEDFHKLKKSVFGADMDGYKQDLEFYNELFGDILPVKTEPSCLYSVPTQDVVRIMNMENMMFAMYDYPELFHEMMDRISDDYIAYFRFLEENHMILPTVSGEGLAQGTLDFTSDLPGWDEYAKRPFTTKDIWGFLDSQETSSISPEMYAEFVFPYYKKIADCYGLLSYGCCEPVDPIWESCISKLENLRKVSVSPWCNEEYMGEQLAGKKIIFHRKPSPNFLGVGDTLDEDALRAHFDKTLRAAKGCTLEFSQRDVYSVSRSPQKVARYVEILREECEKLYQG